MFHCLFQPSWFGDQYKPNIPSLYSLFTTLLFPLSLVPVELHCLHHILHVQAPHSLFFPCGDKPSIENNSILNQYDR